MIAVRISVFLYASMAWTGKTFLYLPPLVFLPYFWDIFNKSTCKAVPLQAWTGPQGYRRFRLLDFKTIGTLRW